ncbi:S8 family peptidase [Caballeronia sp. AAUFL_F2_KS46]|uniref:S8 family peptidase n=2 Tax=Burkholderiaceae TaxID=119060 RepID=UPI00031EC647|nr:S8 family peptidase [Caballeronia sp. AAUFL_F2_KS46]
MKKRTIALIMAASASLAACGGGSSELGSVLPESTQMKATTRLAANEIPTEYASRANVSGLLQGSEYDSFIVYYRSQANESGSGDSAAHRSINDATLATSNNARVAKLRNLSIEERSMTRGRGHVIRASKRMSSSEAQAFMVEYLKSPEVEYIEPNLMLQANLVPNDQFYNSYQWNLSSQATAIAMPAAWEQATGKGVVIAVLDSGYTSHRDLDGQTLPGYNFISNANYDRNRSGRSSDATDPGNWTQIGDVCPSGVQNYAKDSEWHGDHVAGIIAAKTNNGTGIAGVAYNSKILPVRVLGRCGGELSDIADAVVWAAGGSVSGVPDNPYPARVINMSLGGIGACSKTMQDAVSFAVGKGAVIVAASGNANADASTQLPANCRGVLSIGATNSAGNRSATSNYGSSVTVMAPGEAIISLTDEGKTAPQSNNSYKLSSGTSQSAPHVSGVIALMLEKQPSLTLDQIKSVLVSTATSMAGRCPEGCGGGIVNAEKALSSLPIQ